MVSEVTMPKMGYDMTEGTVLRWLKQPGEAVAKGEVLGEIETGKVNIEIEAFDTGELGAILVPEGATVAVGTPIAIIVAPGEAVPERYTAKATPGNDRGVGSGQDGAAPNIAGQTNHVATVTDRDAQNDAEPPTVAPGGRLRASPLARRLAAEHGLDLKGVAGSGPGGRVVRDDVTALLAGEAATVTPATRASPPTPVPISGTALGPAGEAERQPLSRIRQTIARRLSESWVQAPHIFLTMAIDMTAALGLRLELNEALVSRGLKLSVNDLVIKAVAQALRLEPHMNASWDDGGRVQHPRVNVGVAVALDDGLITVTVTDADVKPLATLAVELTALAERARSGRLQTEDLATPSTFTVSNLGMYGVEQFTAILNPPEAGILAVGAALPEAVVREGEVQVRSIMRVTLSADHRVVDGATAAQFLVHLRETLERPLALLV